MFQLLSRCSLVMLMLVLTNISFADEHFPFVGEIKKGSVNVRAGANTNFEIVDKLKQGDAIVVLAKNFEWYKIQLPVTAGVYIRADYIKEIGSGLGEVTGDKVNLRCKAVSESSPLGQALRGDFVKLLEKESDWWKIVPTPGTVAWVHADFVQFKSVELPGKMVVKAITKEDVQAAQTPPAPVISVPAIVPIQAEGVIEALPVVIGENIHYQLTVQGKPVYYLQDVVFLNHFLNAHVKVEGDLVHDTAGLTVPTLKPKKISLLL